jgi:uroporphyrinogen-III synthase
MNTPHGRGVVITRPAGEAARLAQLVREAGGVPLLHPAIAILDAPDSVELDQVIDRLDQFDIAIFISPTAVAKGMARIHARRTLPSRLGIATIGEGGARALAALGVQEVIRPSGRPDSEALLATDFLREVDGKRIVIFRGEGGRELLGGTLTARGARVEYAECYRRGKPALDVAVLNQTAREHGIAAVVFTSSEGVRNFVEGLDDAGRVWLRATPVVVPHPRIARAARELGLVRVVESGAGDEALARTACALAFP